MNESRKNTYRKGHTKMSGILLLRHAPWDFIVNGRERGLNAQGLKMARDLGPSLGYFDIVRASEYLRARQTAQLLTGDVSGLSIWTCLNELDYNYNFPTPEEYTKAVFENHLAEVREQAEALHWAIAKLNPTHRALLVSHRVTMIALYARLRMGRVEAENWDIVDFEPLCGFETWIDEEKKTAWTELVNY